LVPFSNSKGLGIILAWSGLITTHTWLPSGYVVRLYILPVAGMYSVDEAAFLSTRTLEPER
jgi:hypothetical protein